MSSYDDLGLKSYNDILGAFDFLKEIGFKSNSIGLHGISLGASTSIFAAHAEPEIRAVWAAVSYTHLTLPTKRIV